ncbi:MAG: M15 family metallopeptidase [Lachnospiraceae bacterium]|nr:M15 family metallopeptidase [Lachnospiraceae bacterium]
MAKKQRIVKNNRRRWLKIITLFCVLWIAGNTLIGSDLLSSFDLKNIAADEAVHSIPIPEEWNLIVVNRWNEIPEDYSVTLTELSNGQKVDSRIYPYLQEMFDAMRADGIYPIVREGYRTAEEQQEILDERIQRYRNEGYSRSRAERLAKEWVALPGTSEHQLGIAVDINADKTRSANEDVYQWLADHAYQYGFILRYPQGKGDITGAEYEPWHYRYVGTEAALEIYQSQICLEEYMGNH